MFSYFTFNSRTKPMSIVNMCGGLGNQMFQYAFFLALQSKYMKMQSFINIDMYKNYSTHNGFELKRVFGIPMKNVKPTQAIEKLLRKTLLDINHIFENNSIKWQKINDNNNDISIYYGYWQTEKYFKHIAPVVKSCFQFNENKLNKMSNRLMRQIRNQKNTVSIHFRRGDYFKNNSNKYRYGQICTNDYYYSSINKIKELIGSSLNLYIFSDDIQWVKENFNLPNAVLVDWNVSKDSWQDMCLMSVCHHHIIANSTFSWWGAWLGNKSDTVVIAPETWFNTEYSSDILLNNWIKIPIKIPK